MRKAYKSYQFKGLQTFYSKGPHPVLWAGSRAARGQITISAILKLLTCAVLVVCTKFANLVTGRGFETHVQISQLVRNFATFYETLDFTIFFTRFVGLSCPEPDESN